jgi:hypothetical protein
MTALGLDRDALPGFTRKEFRILLCSVVSKFDFEPHLAAVWVQANLGCHSLYIRKRLLHKDAGSVSPAVPYSGHYCYTRDIIMLQPSWNESYASGELPWDMGKPAPLLVEFVNAGGVAPGRTL